MSGALRTERLLLRQWRESDLDPWAALNADPEVREHFPEVLTREQSAASMARFQAALEERGWGWWAVEVASTGEFIGFTGLDPVDDDMPFAGVEIGWRLARSAWGYGYATEAARAALAFGFDTLDLREIVAMTTTTNLRSQAVMRRIGMTRDPADDFDHPEVPDGPLRRHVLYRIRKKVDWVDWHNEYEDPRSELKNRLTAVQQQIRAVLDERPAGPIRVISMCAGQARDLVGALAGHPRRRDVTGLLVELDPRNAELARAGLRDTGLDVLTGDAAETDNYEGAAPADLVLACGIFGNVSDDDIRRTVSYLPQLCAPGATAIWTRHRRPPDLVPTICEWFDGAGFAERFVSDPDAGYGLGVHTFTGTPARLASGERMFSFNK